MSSVKTHKSSGLLSQDENQYVFDLLGPRCRSLATTVVQLFTTEAPKHSEWIKQETGVLCIIRDANLRGYFFRIYCLLKNKMVFEQEIYVDMEYYAVHPFFHTFEAENCMVALNFADVAEADYIKEIVLRACKKVGENKPNAKPISTDIQSDLSSKKRLEKKSGIDKADIGLPFGFEHKVHVGWDSYQGFMIKGNDPALDGFLKQAGISEVELRDKATRKVVKSFIRDYGGTEAVLEAQDRYSRIVSSKPIAPKTPPAVPARRIVPKTPPTNPYHNAGCKANVMIPPPPPMNLDKRDINVPPPPALPQALGGDNSEVNNRVDKISDSKGDLLHEIRKGIKLKPVEESHTPKSGSSYEPAVDLVSILKQKIQERSKFVQLDDSSDSDSSSSEWDNENY